MAKKQDKRLVKYRVIKKAFVNGTLYVPGDIIEAEEGLTGAAFEPVDGKAPAAFEPGAI